MHRIAFPQCRDCGVGFHRRRFADRLPCNEVPHDRELGPPAVVRIEQRRCFQRLTNGGGEAGLVNLGMAAAFEDLLDENRSPGVVPDPKQAAGVIGSSGRFVQGRIQPSLQGRLGQLRGECRFGIGIPGGLCVGQAADRNERDSAASKPHRATFP